MQLTADDEKALDGDQGETVASAYRILLAIGEATDAEKLVPIKMGTFIWSKLQYYW
jgi:predicted aconitase